MPEEIEELVSRSRERASEDLIAEFQGVWSRETIERMVADSAAALAERRTGMLGSPPQLAIRFARERLRALAQAEGHVEKTRPEVLYVCVRNAGRSQIAAALTHAISGGEIAVRSAGSTPGDEIHPEVAAALARVGIDVNQEFPKPLTDEVVQAADVVVTMGCGDACPIYPGTHYEDWEIADPAGQPADVVAQIVEDIRDRVEALVASLAAPAATS